MRVFLRDAAPLASIGELLSRRGDGEVILVAMAEGAREIEIRLPGKYDTGPRVISAVKAAAGVVAVQPL
jgi:DNA polymerase III subunit alpha